MVRPLLLSLLGLVLFGVGVIGFETIVEVTGASRDGAWSIVYVVGMMVIIVGVPTWLHTGEALTTVLVGASVAATFTGVLLHDPSNQWNTAGFAVSYGLVSLGIIGILTAMLYLRFWTRTKLKK